MSQTLPVPDACTLPTVDQPVRLTEIDELLRTSVRSVHRLDDLRLHLELQPDAGVAAKTAELLVRESSCCSFFTFTLVVTEGRLALDVVVPPAHSDVLDGIAQSAGARP